MRTFIHHSLFLILTAAFFITAQSQEVTVLIFDSEFDPALIEVSPGTEVIWVNQGQSVHTTESGVGCTQDGIWDSGDLEQGETYSRVFDTEGSYHYFCDYHCLGGMTGYVEVVDNLNVEEYESGTMNIDFIGPVPSASDIHVEIQINKNTNLQISVFDLRGAEVMKITNKKYHPGDYRFNIDARELESGTYLCRIISGNEVITKKIGIL